MGAELLLAIDACVTESGALLAIIAKTIVQVVKFEGKCKKLLEDAHYLQWLLDSRRHAIQTLQTVEQFDQCFKDIKLFVDRCVRLNYAQATWVIIYTREYPALQKRITALRNIFLMESTAEILVLGTNLASAIDKVDKKVEEGALTQSELLSELRAQSAANEAVRFNPLSARVLQWETLDPKLRILGNLDLSFEGDQQRIAKATHTEIGNVVCYRIEATTFTHSALSLYRNAQDGAYVQRLFGVVQVQGNIYAVMESLDGEQTLAQAITGQTLPQSLLERLQLAYDIAKSMAWYHRAQIKLKSHSDDTIVLKQQPSGRLCAIMTRLEGARHFLEQTSGVSYDLRYEPFEYERLGEHSSYTDVYSLGTVIWQIIGSTFPYAISHALNHSNRGEEYQMVKEKLAQRELPGTFKNIPTAVASIVQRCWSFDPLLRPSSVEVAIDIQNLIMKETSTDKDKTALPAATPSDLAAASRTTFSDGQISASGNRSTVSAEDLEVAMELIRKARKVNLEKSNMENIPESFPGTLFEALINEDNWTAAQYFIVGALIFWNLTDYDIHKLQPTELLTQIPNHEATRARIALFYLESAGEMNYEEAYFEAYKAHALLARVLKDLSKFSIKQLKM